MSKRLHPDAAPRTFEKGDVILLEKSQWALARVGRESFMNVAPSYQGAIGVAQSFMDKNNWKKSPAPYFDDVLHDRSETSKQIDEIKRYASEHGIPLTAHFVVTHPGSSLWSRKAKLERDVPRHSYFPRDVEGKSELENWRDLPFQASLCEPDGKLIDTVRILFDAASHKNPKGIPTTTIIGRSAHLIYDR